MKWDIFFQGATFIQGAMLIPESRVFIQLQATYNYVLTTSWQPLGSP